VFPTRLKQSKTILLIIVSFLPQFLLSQTRVSVATDASVLRSFKEGQQFWAFGQDVVMNWNFTPRSGAYAWVSYYSNGNFENPLSADAKSSTTVPQQISFTNKAQVRFQHVSLGWKYYLVGRSDVENTWSLYTISGLGILFGKASNVYSATIDTSLYTTPQNPINGSGHFKRLTLDLGLGWEIPIGGDLFVYAEAKTWLPTTDYPSEYLLVNQNAPVTGMLTAGFRILF
jgi:hypothetical protein